VLHAPQVFIIAFQDEDLNLSFKELVHTRRGVTTVTSLIVSLCGMAPFIYIEVGPPSCIRDVPWLPLLWHRKTVCKLYATSHTFSVGRCFSIPTAASSSGSQSSSSAPPAVDSSLVCSRLPTECHADLHAGTVWAESVAVCMEHHRHLHLRLPDPDQHCVLRQVCSFVTYCMARDRHRASIRLSGRPESLLRS
jgi:hypothetical protein